MYDSFYSTHLNNQQRLKELTQEAQNRRLARKPMISVRRSALRIALINALLILKVR